MKAAPWRGGRVGGGGKVGARKKGYEGEGCREIPRKKRIKGRETCRKARDPASSPT